MGGQLSKADSTSGVSMEDLSRIKNGGFLTREGCRSFLSERDSGSISSPSPFSNLRGIAIHQGLSYRRAALLNPIGVTSDFLSCALIGGSSVGMVS
jgi:hypothetical protein